MTCCYKCHVAVYYLPRGSHSRQTFTTEGQAGGQGIRYGPYWVFTETEYRNHELVPGKGQDDKPAVDKQHRMSCE